MTESKLSRAERTELVLQVVRGELDAVEAATRAGVEPEQIERWREEFLRAGSERVESLPSQREPPVAPGGSSRGARLVGALAAIVLLLGIAALAVFAVRRAQASRESDSARLCREGTVRLAASARDPVRVVLYSSAGNAELERASRDLDAVLVRYAKESKGHIQYQHRVVSAEEDRSRALEDGLQPFAAADSDAGTVTNSIFGLVVSSGTEKSAIPVLPLEANAGFPFWFANKLREVVAKAEGRSVNVGVLSGMDELGLDDPNLVDAAATRPNLVGILAQSFPYYAIHKVPVTAASDELGKNQVLIVTQPGRQLTDAELASIDDYLMLGEKTLVVVASAANVAPGDPALKVSLDRHGLERLLAGYGIELGNDVVFDPGAHVELTAAVTSGLAKLSAPALPLVSDEPNASAEKRRLRGDFAGFFRLDALVFPGASTLGPHAEKQPDARLQVVAKTTERAVGSSEPGASLAFGAAVPAGVAGERAVAVALDGKIKSAFGSRSATGRLLVIASSLFLTNPFVRAARPGAADPALAAEGQAYAQRHLTTMILATKNVLDWGTSDPALLACASLLNAQTKR